ncbi:unnamed protein product [Calypogeia fissa]
MGGLTPEQQKQQQQQSAANEQLFQYLNSLLQQAEAASGTPELELRSKIEALRTETQRVPTPSTSGMSEVEVASKLDQLSAKMESVNKLLTEVEKDPETKNFLQSSSELWMPVITATAEERRAASSSQPSTILPTKNDGTNSRESQ